MWLCCSETKLCGNILKLSYSTILSHTSEHLQRKPRRRSCKCSIICVSQNSKLTSVIFDMRHRSFSLISVMWPWPLVPLCLPLTIPEPVHQSPPTQPPKQTHQSVRASAKHQLTVALLSTHKHTAESTVSSFPNDNYTLNSSTAVRMWFLSRFEKIRTMKQLSSYHKDFFYSNWHRSMTSNSFFFFF